MHSTSQYSTTGSQIKSLSEKTYKLSAESYPAKEYKFDLEIQPWNSVRVSTHKKGYDSTMQPSLSTSQMLPTFILEFVAFVQIYCVTASSEILMFKIFATSNIITDTQPNSKTIKYKYSQALISIFSFKLMQTNKVCPRTLKTDMLGN